MEVWLTEKTYTAMAVQAVVGARALILVCFTIRTISPTHSTVHAYGSSHVILSENGKEFNNNLDKSLDTLRVVHRRLTTLYHPQVQKPKISY